MKKIKVKNIIVIIGLLVLLSFLGSMFTSCSAALDWKSNNWLDNIVGWFKKDNDKKEEESEEEKEEEALDIQTESMFLR